MIERFIKTRILEALEDRPVVFLTGPRQVGKSTLVLWLSENDHPATYFSFDDLTTYSMAHSDPVGFVAGLKGNVIFDEIQRVPDLFYAIKMAVDRDRMPGRFLLTGSANISVLPKLSEALVGRMEVIPLSPLAICEITGRKFNIVDYFFSEKSFETAQNIDGNTHPITHIISGGYPEVYLMKKTHRYKAWFDSYLGTLIQRDMREISQIQGIADLPRLLRILAAQTGQLLNIANLSRGSGIEQKTLKRYLSLLEGLFIITLLPAWFRNIGKRLIKAPKVFFNDTGVLVHLLGNIKIRESDYFGQIVENFVLLELMKQASWSNENPSVCYYRTAGGSEVDFVLENQLGKLIAVEVKGSSTLKSRTVKPMRDFRNHTGDQFHRGIIFYLGNRIIPVEENIHAIPINWLLK